MRPNSLHYYVNDCLFVLTCLNETQLLFAKHLIGDCNILFLVLVISGYVSDGLPHVMNSYTVTCSETHDYTVTMESYISKNEQWVQLWLKELFSTETIFKACSWANFVLVCVPSSHKWHHLHRLRLVLNSLYCILLKAIKIWSWYQYLSRAQF